MTISFDIIWIPIVLSVSCILIALRSLFDNDGWFSGVFEIFFLGITLPIIWLGYFTLLYFTTK